MNPRTKRIVRGSQRLLLVFGCSVLGYCAFAVVATSYYQVAARQLLRHSAQETDLLTSTTRKGLTLREPLRAVDGVATLGRVDIPRLRLSAMVAEGDSPQVLRLAVGHVPGTALPWQSGNVALVAHRDTFFRRLSELTSGDVVRMTVPGAQYSYRVTFTDIVAPDQTWVLQPSSRESLTLITCYPFHFIGSAPQRFVVRAHRFSEDASLGNEQK